MGTFLEMTCLSNFKRPVLACLSALMIAGCSNSGDTAGLRDTFKSIFSPKASNQGAVATKIDMNAVLKQTAPTSLMHITFLDRGNIASLLLQISSSNGYRVYSTAAKQTITLRDGLITSTRGTGDDLMASISTDSRSAIRARRAGKGTRVMEHVNGAGETLRETFSCETFVTGSGRVKQGAVNAATTELTENCVSENNKFTNVYQVGQSGMVLSSTQWLGQSTGYAKVSILRP